MAAQYAHKKFDSAVVYNHKKFGSRLQKRDRTDMEVSQCPEVMTSLATEQDEQQPLPKRCCQTGNLFRPWLGANVQEKSTSKVQSEIIPLVDLTTLPYHSSMVRQQPPKQRSPKEQQRRERNTLSCLRNRRSHQLEQIRLQREYALYQQRQFQLQQETLRSNLYLRHLHFLQAQATLSNQQINAVQNKDLFRFCAV